MPVWLIGMMGSGKSTLGRIIASRRGWTFIDTDEVVVEAAGLGIGELFSQEGEAGFRVREAAAVSSVSSHPGAVVATGGGAILLPDNVEVMRRTGLVFWLQAEPATLAARIEAAGSDAGDGRGSRPLIFDDDLVQSLTGILEERQDNYRLAADYVIGTDLLSLEEAADLVEALWHD